MLKDSFLGILVLVMALLQWGCNTTGSSNVSTKDFAVDGSKDGVVAVTKLAEGNKIEVSVEVEGRMEVSAHQSGINHFGIVTLPLVGDLKIGELTVDQARKVIGSAYSSYYVNPPVIMVSLVDDPEAGEWGYVTITGRVGTPGRVKVTSAKGIKLTTLIQEAGGFSPSAKKSDIRISRTEEGGRKIQTSIDYTEIGLHGNIDEDISLVDGDIVYVPERMF